MLNNITIVMDAIP